MIPKLTCLVLGGQIEERRELGNRARLVLEKRGSRASGRTSRGRVPSGKVGPGRE